MRFLFFLIFLTSFIDLHGQAPVKLTTLKLTAKDCRHDQVRVLTFRFYKLPEDTLAFLVDLYKDDKLRGIMFVRNVPVSKYRLEYKDIYHQQRKKYIYLNDTIENVLTICPDSLPAKKYRQNTIARLEENDTIVIYCRTIHMFFTSNKILIRKNCGNIYATLYQNYLEDSIWMKRKEIILTDVQIGNFVRFENEIQEVREKDCSLESFYKIRSRYFNYVREGGECDWFGFALLRYSFFGNN